MNKSFRGVLWLAGVFIALNAPQTKDVVVQLFRGGQRNIEALYGRSDTIKS